MTTPGTSLFCSALVLGFCTCTAAAQFGAEPIRATDLLEVRQIDDVRISPDGRQIVYSVRSVASDDRDSLSYRTHLFLIDAGEAGAPRQLTRGRRSAEEPAWHPGSERIAFVRDVDGTPQVFILPLLGGEAYQVTDLEHGATAPQWSPDGSRLLVASFLPEPSLREHLGRPPPWTSERPGRSRATPGAAEADPDGSLLEIRAWLDRNADHGDPRVFHRLDLQGEHDLEPMPRYRHLFVIEVDTTATPRMITRGYAHFTGAGWLPDGDRIIAAGKVYDRLHPDRTEARHLYTIRTDGSGINLLLDLPGLALDAPSVSPDGRRVAFTARDTTDRGYAQTELGVLDIEDPAAARMLTDSLDRSVSSPRWSGDGWYVYFTAPSDGGVPLFRLRPFDVPPDEQAPQDISAEVATADDTATQEGTDEAADDTTAQEGTANDTNAGQSIEIERLSSFARAVHSFDIGRASVYFAATEVANPYDLYSAGLSFGGERRVTSHNASWLEDKHISFPERYTLTRDSLRIEYWVMKPVHFDSTRQYPLLLQIHGGPSGMWGPGEATMWHELQYFAAKGYAIVFSNPRGSGGYGQAFKRANYRDWGAGPAGDVLAAADRAAALPWTDSTRQVVTGGSYAGYLTAWIAAQDHRFQAAVAQRGVYDLGMFLGEGNAWRLVPSHFGAYPWEQDAADSTANAALVLALHSPLTYVDRIRTPLLIMHADDDLRTGVGQSEVLYKSLKILGRPVEYVRYPSAGHDLSRTGDPAQRIDRLLRIYEFFERFIQ